jgi:16S rRNA G966 N2-methylase RsmD
MERRNFLKGVVSLPVVPSLDVVDIGSEEEYWEIECRWSSKYDWGQIKLIKDGEMEHRFEFDNYSVWQKASLINARFVADSGSSRTDYVADLWDLNLKYLYIDPPYFFSQFENESSEAQIRQGKYSESEYVYVVESHDDEALRGADGGADSIEEVLSEVAEVVRD